jgi:hypothetical protein
MQKLDEELYQLLLTLPRFPFLSLVRQDKRGLTEARRKFENEGVIPTFCYSRAARFDAAGYLAKLDEVEIRIWTKKEIAPLIGLYLKKCAELRARAELILAVQKGDDEEVTRLAKIIFAAPSFTVEELVSELRQRKIKNGFTHRARVDAEMFARMTRQMLDYYGLTDWRIKLAPRLTMQIGHGKRDRSPMVRIPRNMLVSKQRAIRLLTHEIEVHALRTGNGANSPLRLLERGCAGYIKTDEGLAMYYQEVMLADESPKIIHAGFWEAYTVALTELHDFAGVFDELKKVTTADKAWRLCVRAYRGITKPNKIGLGFYRDHVYRSGFMAVQAAHRTGGLKFLGEVFCGNVSIKDLPVMRELRIPAGRLPDLIAEKVVKDELRRLKKLAA